ncbi:MAG: hypothetical protein ACI9D5_001468 [Candidatus Endobugula sp.]|jgi:hypothetical protein
MIKYPIEGSCQCGQVTYKLNGKPRIVVACHCTECQKLSTSPFSVTAIISANTIEFNGELKNWGWPADSGNRTHAKFCPTCGNRIYHYNPKDSETIRLKLKPVNFSDDTLFEPSTHVWVCEKLSWYRIPDGVKIFEKQPE